MSSRTTGSPALARWAAMREPMVPAPRTATLRICFEPFALAWGGMCRAPAGDNPDRGEDTEWSFIPSSCCSNSVVGATCRGVLILMAMATYLEQSLAQLEEIRGLHSLDVSGHSGQGHCGGWVHAAEFGCSHGSAF